MIPNHLHLLSPLRLGALNLGHRIFCIGRPPSLALDGQARADATLLEHYQNRASQGGLVICSLAPVQTLCEGGTIDLGLHSAPEVNGWRAITQAIHARGGLAVARIGNALAPDDLLPNTDEIDEALDAYRTAAENASDAGFDGVELVGTTGSLPDRLLRASSELAATLGTRVDNLSGLDFLDGVFQSLFGTWPAQRVGLCLTLPIGAGQLDLACRALRSLDTFELAYTHLSAVSLRQGVALEPVAMQLRAVFRGGLIASGAWSPDAAQAVIRRGDVDAVGPEHGFGSFHDMPEHWAGALSTGR
jgi:N-ethylmaleimide reductase